MHRVCVCVVCALVRARSTWLRGHADGERVLERDFAAASAATGRPNGRNGGQRISHSGFETSGSREWRRGNHCECAACEHIREDMRVREWLVRRSEWRRGEDIRAMKFEVGQMVTAVWHQKARRNGHNIEGSTQTVKETVDSDRDGWIHRERHRQTGKYTHIHTRAEWPGSFSCWWGLLHCFII